MGGCLGALWEWLTRWRNRARQAARLKALLDVQVAQMERSVNAHTYNLRRIKKEIKDPAFRDQVPELRAEWQNAYVARETYRKSIGTLRASATQLDVTLATADTVRLLSESTALGKAILNAKTLDDLRRAVDDNDDTKALLGESHIAMDQLVPETDVDPNELAFILGDSSDEEEEEDVGDAVPLMLPEVPTHVPARPPTRIPAEAS